MISYRGAKLAINFPDELYQRENIIYGCSKGSLNLYNLFINYNINISAFTDTYAEEKREKYGLFCGKPIYSLKELENKRTSINIIIGTGICTYVEEIIDLLIDKGFKNYYIKSNFIYPKMRYDLDKMEKLINNNRTKINFVKNNLSDDLSKKIFENLINHRLTNQQKYIDECCRYLDFNKQYFRKDIFTIGEEEVLIDAGGYIGDSVEEFIDFVDGKYKYIYSFEPDETYFQIATTTFKLKNVKGKIFPYGLSEKNGIFGFEENHFAQSALNEKGGKKIEVITLDNFCDKNSITPTFIKMDIEGAEKMACKGAYHTIRNNMPKLAICIYHLEDDLWEIPFYLMKEFEDYKFYIRHHSNTRSETVLYALK
ncbi:MAG: FkbM family methyltransferase [Lachnospiraceae bacterium]|nr:FkbM family methyltransferase [Lachnospiraceae bacterium]